MLSMTGYGRRQISRDGREVTVEIKTVNHRFLDISFRLPRALSFAEDALRKRLGDALRRGHADVTVTYQNMRDDAREVLTDLPLARKYAEALEKIGGAIHEGIGCDAKYIASLPDVMTLSLAQEDQEAVLSLLMDAADAALTDVTAMRGAEGQRLSDDLTEHIGLLEGLTRQIAALAPGVPKAYRDKLESRLKEMGVEQLEPQRMAQEVALLADKCAIDEELSRLDSHIGQMRQMIAANGETGRKLDFLTQELNREVNTIGSKASDAAITRLVVDAKSEIEKLREQVQNVE